MQYLQCQFKRGEGRSYTYRNDRDETFAVGDAIVVEGHGGSTRTVYVSGIQPDTFEEPTNYELKNVLRRADPKEAVDTGKPAGAAAIAPGFDFGDAP